MSYLEWEDDGFDDFVDFEDLKGACDWIRDNCTKPVTLRFNHMEVKINYPKLYKLGELYILKADDFEMELSSASSIQYTMMKYKICNVADATGGFVGEFELDFSE